MAEQVNVQINCPYLNQMIMNGRQVAICQQVKQNISNVIGEYCIGNKCPFPKI